MPTTTTITPAQKLILAGHTPCAPLTVQRVLRGKPVRPAIEARIRAVAAQFNIPLPASRANGGAR